VGGEFESGTASFPISPPLIGPSDSAPGSEGQGG
jgi:hypothetical protein